MASGRQGEATLDLARRALHDRNALVELLSDSWAILWPLCFRAAVADRTLAEDFVQETVLRALRGLRSFSPGRSFPAWLRGIGSRVVADHFRRQSARQRALQVVAMGQDSESGTGPQWTEERERLPKLLGDLDPVSRLVLSLRYDSRCSWAEIGEAVGLSEEAVKKRLHRARSFLRQELMGMRSERER